MNNQIITDFQQKYEDIENELKTAIIGQNEVIKLLLIGIISGGNILMEGAPGLGKTQLIKKISEVLSLSFARIQFTPDLMPVDILGTYSINKTENDLSINFNKGPIFNSLILADEINRATPKTQSAMLEAMQEKTVKIGNETYKLPESFFVLATQNPLEMEGTYPLPEAQLDRFMFKLDIGLPSKEAISKIIDITTGQNKNRKLNKIATDIEIIDMKNSAEKVLVATAVKEFAINIMMNTHPEYSELEIVKKYVKSGVSPRGVQSIIEASRVLALSQGRFNVSEQDIIKLAVPCLRHRMFLSFSASVDDISSDDIITEIIKKVK